MAAFSSSLQSTIIDPVFHSDTRCEFRIQNRGQAYMPTLRIGNIGLEKTGAASNAYHFGSGTSSVISRIRLLDGQEELDSLRNVAQWLTFKGALKTNSQNTNVFNNLNGDSQGWIYGATGELIEANTKQVREGDEATLGLLDLRECFPFLNSVSHLSTKLFKNLRVVIEYVPKSQKHLLVNSQVAANVGLLKKSIPILICDEIRDDALVAALDKQMTGASWVAIEHDLANLPAPSTALTQANAETGGISQRVQLRMNGCLGKAVSRVMIAKTYESTGAAGPNVNQGTIGVNEVKALGGYGSKAFLKETFNMRLNGRNVLGGEGLTSPAQITMMCSDTWGAMDLTPFSNQQSVGLDTVYTNYAATPAGPANIVGITKTAPSVLTTAPGAAQPQQGYWISNSSWIGLPVNERVSDLMLDIGRTCVYSEGTSSSAGGGLPMNIHLFSEVSKAMSVSGGSYKVFYS